MLTLRSLIIEYLSDETLSMSQFISLQKQMTQ